MGPPCPFPPSAQLIPLSPRSVTQDQLDRKNSRTKQDALQAKRFRDRLVLRLRAWADNRFADLLDLASKAGEYNSAVRWVGNHHVGRHGSHVVGDFELPIVVWLEMGAASQFRSQLMSFFNFKQVFNFYLSPKSLISSTLHPSMLGQL